MFIQEFYSNTHGIDTSVPQFVTTFKGTRIVVTLNLIFEVLHVPRVMHLDNLTMIIFGLFPKTSLSLTFVRLLSYGW